jgi:hypothetical protein
MASTDSLQNRILRAMRTPVADPRLFSERVKWRHHVYWRRRWLTLHPKVVCQLTYRTRDDSFEKWHCCRLWQRNLTNKWNSREFAQKLGCPVPELYWVGTRLDQIPFDRLPDRYVMRAVVGTDRKAVLVLDRGTNLLNGKRYDREMIRNAMHPHVGRVPARRLLIEEFIPAEAAVRAMLPRDYKLYMFAGHVGAILVIERRPEAFYLAVDEAWRPIPLLDHGAPIEEPPEPPACLDQMIAIAQSLGRAYGSFVRVDVYAGPNGAVFGELTGTPAEGRGFSEFADRYLRDLWDTHCPGTL